MNYKISIVTIVYNGEEYLERTLKSIVNQVYNNYELILIDGGSKDGTHIVIEKYKKYISTIVSEEDEGIYDAMNKGLMHCRGDYVIFMNAGDTFASNDVLDRIFNVKNKIKIDFIYGDSNVVNQDKKFFKRARNHKFIWLGMFTNHQAMFYNRSLIENNHLIYDLKYNISADYQFTLKFLRLSNTFEYVPISICDFYLDGISSLDKLSGLEQASEIRKSDGNYSRLKVKSIHYLILLRHFIADKFSYLHQLIRYN